MIYTHKIYRLIVIGSLFSCVIPGMAQAGGFGLIENSASGQGNAYAGAAAHVTDASTIFFNPAGMMQLEGDSISIAGHFIMPDASFTNNGSVHGTPGVGGPLTTADDDGGVNAFVPNFYWVKTIDEQMKFGLGVQTTFGLATEYKKGWTGQYHAVETDLKTVNLNPSIAYQVNDKLSVGGGLDFVIGEIIFTSAIDFSNLNPALPDGFADLTADNYSDPGLGFNFGLQYEIDMNTIIGASFRSEIDLDFSGDADFTVPVPGFPDGGLTSTVTLPASLALSVAKKMDKITYLADITWTGWSSFDELRIVYDSGVPSPTVTTEDWDDTFRYSVGFDYQYSDKMVLRSGLAYDETPIPSPERRTARIPGNDRTWLSFGLTYMLDDQSSIDVGYSHLFIDDTEINNTLETINSGLNATLTGTYTASVDILSVQWNKKF